MTAIEVKELKKEVKKHIDQADERMLRAVNAMLEADQEERFSDLELENEYSDEFKAELNSRYEEYKCGGKLISEEDANLSIRKIFHG